MPVVAFFGAIFSRIGQLILVKWITGALKTTAIYTLLIGALAAAIFALTSFVNKMLLDWINGLSPVGQLVATSIAAMLPPNMPYLISAALAYFAFSAGTHLTIEIAKLKAQWAEKALGSFKA